MSHPLKQFIEKNAQELFYSLRVYVSKAGISDYRTLDDVTRAVLSDMVVEALNHAERFDPERSPKAWLLGVGANVIRRRQQAVGKHNQREPFVRDLTSVRREQESDAELWDQVVGAVVDGPAVALEMEERVKGMLELVSKDDQRVLRLAILNDLNGEELAGALEVTPGTARVRLHRALQRLRQAWQQREVSSERMRER